MRGWTRTMALAATAAMGLTALPAGATAQGRDQERGRGVPRGYLPPAGQCRVWFDGRRPNQQPAPTSCDRAREIARREGGRVIEGRASGGDVVRRPREAHPARGTDRSRYPAALPLMAWAVDFSRGVRMDDARPWIGPGSFTVQRRGETRSGTPEVVVWTRPNGTIIQRWVDRDGDGRADVVTIYRDGRAVKVIR